MATSRRPLASAARRTPVRIGRASSLDAARTTWDSAVASSALASVTGSPVASVSRGNSSAGSTRRLNSERPAEMRASSSATSTSTLPAGRARTMSEARRPGRTTTPSPSPDTVTSTEIVSSRSVPVRRSWSPVSSHADAGEHGQGGAAPSRRSAGGAEGLDEDITLASELHAVARFLPSCCASQRRSGGRGCGLGMTSDLPRSARVWLSDRGIHRIPQGCDGRRGLAAGDAEVAHR